MTLHDFLLGLNILLAHYNDPDGYHLGADHDIIYIYPTDTPLSSEEVKTMDALGFFQPDVMPENDMDTRIYAPNEGWAVYV